MAEPASTTAFGVLLAKYGVVIGGFAGALASLMFLQGLTRKQALMAVLTGLAAAIFCTPLAIEFFKIAPGSETQYGVAFLIGLLAMNIIPGLRALAGKFGATGGA
ncbi:peptidase M48, Ste24p [Pseudomonas fluorescens group sp. PF-1]